MKRLKLLWSIVKRCNADKILYSFFVNFFVVAAIITLVESSIQSYGDGMWYTFVACTTIGFGDFAAVTLIGRLATVYMAINEILLIGILPGIIVTYFMEVIHRRENGEVEAILDKLIRLPELSKEELQEIADKAKDLRG